MKGSETSIGGGREIERVREKRERKKKEKKMAQGEGMGREG